MTQLNLPPFNHRVKDAEGKLWIFDVIRRKFLVLTPEEWVRQHFVNYLTVHLKYPKSLIRVEGGLTYNQLSKRSDIVVFDRNGKPWMLVECKAPSVKLDQYVIQQAAMYNSNIAAKYLAVSNGLAQMVCKISGSAVTILDTLPPYENDETFS